MMVLLLDSVGTVQAYLECLLLNMEVHLTLTLDSVVRRT